MLAGVVSLGGATALADGPTVLATSGDEFFPKTVTIQADQTSGSFVGTRTLTVVSSCP